jgi:hypothetical protein
LAWESPESTRVCATGGQRRATAVLSVEERFMIREMHNGSLSINGIAQRTGHDRKTLRKRLNGS